MPVLSFVLVRLHLGAREKRSLWAVTMKTALPLAGWLAASLVSLTPSAWPQDQERTKRFNVWDIHVGDAVSAIPEEYVNQACGTNGGPPAQRLANFSQFNKCKPDADGLHEVYFEYDDELEYVARALDDQRHIRMYAGTTVYEFPIVASVLIDDGGVVRGERMVTDPRQQVSRNRKSFWELANFLHQRYGDDDWSCTDLPPAEGEKQIGPTFLKNHCEKNVEGMHLILEQRLFQKKGQEFIDPVTGNAQVQPFESATRFEMYDAALPLRHSN
jgi:hypothetical protein